MKLDVELRDEKINGLQRELEELQLGGANEVCIFLTNEMRMNVT
jgi:hypothetical protein